MKKTLVFAVRNKVFIISIEPSGHVCVMVLPRTEMDIYVVTAEGNKVAENLIDSCQEAGLSQGDIILIANIFQVALPIGTGSAHLNFAFA